ncbi:hypothetical protein [Streptomyces griseoflavus]|uniref:hypothetical protein n=1 Tax=Streptomyces griseoflavus TaxID=35619 RepID=UPI0002DEB35C|nr:hypothetical protein [Streptomyces griseoflavus]
MPTHHRAPAKADASGAAATRGRKRSSVPTRARAVLAPLVGGDIIPGPAQRCVVEFKNPRP